MVAHELRRRVRDRSALVTGFVAPLILTGILGFAFAGGGAVHPVRIGMAVAAPKVTVHGETRAGSVNGTGLVGRTLISEVVAAGRVAAALPDWVSTTTVSNPGALRREVADGVLDGGVIVPDNLGLTSKPVPDRTSSTPFGSRTRQSVSTRVSTSPEALSRLLTPVVSPGTGNVGDGLTVIDNRTSLVGAQAASALASGIAARVYAGVLTDSSARSHSIGSAVAAAARPPDISVAIETIGNAGHNVLDYFAPSIAVIFLFITAGLGTRALVAERSEGTLARMAAAPVRASSIVMGRLVAILGIGLVSMVVVWGATSLVFHAAWGNWAGVLLMCVGSTVAIGGVSVFLASWARDERQAFGIAMIAGLALALLGGNLLPPGALPGFLSDLSLGTPNGWALVGFGRLALEGAGVAAVLGPLAVLGMIGIVFGAAAASRLHRMVES